MVFDLSRNRVQPEPLMPVMRAALHVASDYQAGNHARHADSRFAGAGRGGRRRQQRRADRAAPARAAGLRHRHQTVKCGSIRVSE